MNQIHFLKKVCKKLDKSLSVLREKTRNNLNNKKFKTLFNFFFL
jgi:hypothetical protein